MWYMRRQERVAPNPPRDRLLQAAIEHLAAHGLADVSLRRLAAALGTSHRMLIYHFGSRDGLLVEVVREVEAQQRRAFAELREQNGNSPRQFARDFWRRLTDPHLAPHERLFFELYGQALQGQPYADSLLHGVIEDWLATLTPLMHERHQDHRVAGADARLAVAVARGLLLDLLATNDREAVDAAFERYLAAFFPSDSEP
jgi:AcrR family transcriptional regulator